MNELIQDDNYYYIIMELCDSDLEKRQEHIDNNRYEE